MRIYSVKIPHGFQFSPKSHIYLVKFEKYCIFRSQQHGLRCWTKSRENFVVAAAGLKVGLMWWCFPLNQRLKWYPSRCIYHWLVLCSFPSVFMRAAYCTARVTGSESRSVRSAVSCGHATRGKLFCVPLRCIEQANYGMNVQSRSSLSLSGSSAWLKICA